MTETKKKVTTPTPKKLISEEIKKLLGISMKDAKALVNKINKSKAPSKANLVLKKQKDKRMPPYLKALLRPKASVDPSLNTGKANNNKTKVEKPKDHLNRKVTDSNSSAKKDYGKITKNPDVFIKTLEVLLKSNINDLRTKGIEVDESLLTINIAECYEQVKYYHNNLVEHNKLPFGFQFNKEVVSYCIQLLETPKSEHNSVKTPRLSTGKIDRWPTAYSKLRPLFYNVREQTEISHVCDQIIRSLLNIYRSCEDYSEISVLSITRKAKPIPPEFLEKFDTWMKRKFKENNVKGEKIWYTKPNINQTKSGPNSGPSYLTAGKEAYALIHTDNFILPFQDICIETSNLPLLEYIHREAANYRDSLERAYKNDTKGQFSEFKTFDELLKHDQSITVLRQILAVPDSGHKSRTIAISDYWTQVLLVPFEQDLVRVTMSLYSDHCDYFSHSKGFQRIKENIRSGDRFDDAKDWTDCFRAQLQIITCRNLYNSNIAESWEALVVKCKWNVGIHGDFQVVYEEGQGMGTRGSFQMAQLTSCLLNDFIFETYMGIPFNKQRNLWRQVGDDRFDHDPQGKIAEVYELLDIPLNPSKAKICTDKNLCAEYVSRNINFGKDVSRISFNLCHSITDNLLNVTSLLYHINERTEKFDWELWFDSVLGSKSSGGKMKYNTSIRILFFKAIALNSIIFPDEPLHVLSIPLRKSLEKMKDIENSKLLNFKKLNADYKYVVYIKLALLEHIFKKIQETSVKLQTRFFDEKSTYGFKSPEYELIDKIVDMELKKGKMFPWKELPETWSGQAVYSYMLAFTVQSFNKFFAELYSTATIDGKEIFNPDSDCSGPLLDLLERELSRLLVKLTPSQIFKKASNMEANKSRQRLGWCLALLKYFKEEKAFNELRVTFKCEYDEMSRVFPQLKLKEDVPSIEFNTTDT